MPETHPPPPRRTVKLVPEPVPKPVPTTFDTYNPMKHGSSRGRLNARYPGLPEERQAEINLWAKGFFHKFRNGEEIYPDGNSPSIIAAKEQRNGIISGIEAPGSIGGGGAVCVDPRGHLMYRAPDGEAGEGWCRLIYIDGTVFALEGWKTWGEDGWEFIWKYQGVFPVKELPLSITPNNHVLTENYELRLNSSSNAFEIVGKR